MDKIGERELCLRKVHTHLLADPPRIIEAMVTIQSYGEQLGTTVELLEFTQDTPVCDERLKFTQRQINALEKLDIIFLGQLLAAPRTALETLPYFESAEVFRKLESHKLFLGMQLPESSQVLQAEARIWTSKVPTREGWYWVRMVGWDSEPIITHFDEARLRVLANASYSFCGPISYPPF